jgi:nitroreductase
MNRLRGWMKKCLLKSPAGISFYYSVITTKFRTEHVAVQDGIAQYHKNPGHSCLRRNIHRLEKGLSMKNRRDLFAMDYLGETIDAYKTEAARDAASPLVSYARDVLSDYFQAVSKTDHVAELEKAFNDVVLHAPKGNASPARLGERGVSLVQLESLLRLAQTRKSIRWFQPKPVPREFIDQAIDVARFAPSACNRQPFEFRVIDDPELLKEVVAIPMGIVGYADNIPALAIIIGKLNCFFDERDRHLIYIDGSLAGMSFVLALESLGLSSCCINWPDMPEKDRQMASVLKLETYERPVMLIAIGYADPDQSVPYSQKKSLDMIRRYNFE